MSQFWRVRIAGRKRRPLAVASAFNAREVTGNAVTRRARTLRHNLSHEGYILDSVHSRGLSKSKLVSSLQCAKRLWLEVHRPALIEHSPSTEQVFAVGHAVGEVARRLVPGGVLIESDNNISRALAETQEAIALGVTLMFEPTFQHDGVLVRADILSFGPGGVKINEVKASTSVKDYHVKDAAIQAWVVSHGGLNIASIAIQHIDNRFVYPGGGDYRGLFICVPVDREVEPLLREVPKWIAAARSTLAGPEPNVEMGDQCMDPFQCPFIGYCEALAPQTEFPLTLLPNAGRTIAQLIAEGWVDLKDIPEGRLTNKKQERVRRAHVNRAADFDPVVMNLMREFAYPRAFLDFETINFAVPIWKGVRPYQQIAFQWSLHVESPRARTQHFEFLDLTGDLPAEPFLNALLGAIPDEGPVFAYSAGFEKACLGTLAALVPSRMRAVERVQARLVDLLPLTRNHYYHPDMRGSWSLKSVLPTITGGRNYSDLGEVQEGGSAQSAFVEAIAPDTTHLRKSELRTALLNYCKRDTEALVILSRFLQGGPS